MATMERSRILDCTDRKRAERKMTWSMKLALLRRHITWPDTNGWLDGSVEKFLDLGEVP